MPETRAEYKERLQQEGRWQTFLDKRAALVAAGMSSADAKLKLDAEFGIGAKGVVDTDTLAITIEGGRAQEKEPPSKQYTKELRELKAKKCSEREAAQWVFEHLCLEPAMSEAPSAGAWGLLTMCQKYPKVMESFLTVTWPKLLPTKSQMEVSDRFSDDGRSIINMIARVQKFSAEAQEK